MSDEDRAERLRSRRNAAKDKAAESVETGQPSKTDKQSKTVEQSETEQTDETEGSEDETESVKDEHVGVMMYLPESQRDEVSYQFDRLKAEYKRETGEELEKNRHFYPLIVKHGLDSLEGWEGQDAIDSLESLE